MTIPNIARTLARWESALFPTAPVEICSVDGSKVATAESVRAVLDGRPLMTRLEPFIGFASPPGRF